MTVVAETGELVVNLQQRLRAAEIPQQRFAVHAAGRQQRFVRMPGLVAAPGPRRHARSRGVAEQVPNGDVAHWAVGVVHVSQLREVVDDRVVQAQHPSIPQLHDGYSRERLSDRGPMVDRVLVHGPVCGHVGKAKELSRQDLVVFQEPIHRFHYSDRNQDLNIDYNNTL